MKKYLIFTVFLFLFASLCQGMEPDAYEWQEKDHQKNRMQAISRYEEEYEALLIRTKLNFTNEFIEFTQSGNVRLRRKETGCADNDYGPADGICFNDPKWSVWLSNACKYDELYKKIKFILERGANPNEFYALHGACSKGAIENVKLLLTYKADPNLENNHAQTPLTTALKVCKSDCDELNELFIILLEAGADINLQNKQNQTAIEYAKYKGLDKLAEAIQIFILKKREREEALKLAQANKEKMINKNNSRCRLQ